MNYGTVEEWLFGMQWHTCKCTSIGSDHRAYDIKHPVWPDHIQLVISEDMTSDLASLKSTDAMGMIFVPISEVREITALVAVVELADEINGVPEDEREPNVVE